MMMHDAKTIVPASGFSPLPGDSVRAVAAFGAECEPGPCCRWAAAFDGRGRIQTRSGRSLEPSARKIAVRRTAARRAAARRAAARRAAVRRAAVRRTAVRRTAMSPFVQIRPFQNRVTKSAKKGQKVPKSDIGSFPATSRVKFEFRYPQVPSGTPWYPLVPSAAGKSRFQRLPQRRFGSVRAVWRGPGPASEPGGCR